MVSQFFIDECKFGANSNRFGIISVDGASEDITQSNYLSSFSIDSGCFVDGNIIGSIYIKKLEGNFISVPESLELEGKSIQALVGVKYAPGYSEYMGMGNFIVERPNDLKTANKCKITAYDGLISKINNKYISTINYSQGNKTLKDIYIDVCNQLDLTPATTNFLNDDIPVNNNPFTNGETNRVVLQTVAKIACSFITIDEFTNEIDLSWLSDDAENLYVNVHNVYVNDDFITLRDFCEQHNVSSMSEYYDATEYYALQSSLIEFDSNLKYLVHPHPIHIDPCMVGGIIFFSENYEPLIELGIDWEIEDRISHFSQEDISKIKYLSLIIFEFENSTSYNLKRPDLEKIKTKLSNFKIFEGKEDGFYEFGTSDYSTLEGGTIEYGPINSVTIKNSQIDDENVTQQDDESVEAYGEHSIVINDDYILYDSALRQQAMTAIFNRLNGLKYVDSKITCYYGKPFLKIGQKIRIYTDSENYFDTYVLKHNFTYDGTFTSVIESPALTEQEIKTKQDVSLREALRNTEIKVNKQDGTISLINDRTSEIRDDLNNNYYTIEQTNRLVSDAETGLTNTFKKSGGNNVLRNTGLWFKQSDVNNPYEYWEGIAEQSTEDNASSKTKILLKNSEFEQKQTVANGDYTISFKYQKLISLATATVTINDRTYSLAETDVTEFCTGQKDENGQYITLPLEVSSNQIDIKFTCDTDNAVEVYDLMCNQGSDKAVWSQNQNETTTDTVNISQGITIISSTKNTKFKADADGVRIFDKNDSTNSDPITEFTDKGMTTKEAVIENQSTIVGILRQQVGDQIWDCLII